MKPLPNYYKLLGIPSSASPDEIIQAFRKRILQVHLDKLPSGEDSSVCYSTIEAYRVLSNRESRKLYDIKYDKEKRNCNFEEVDNINGSYSSSSTLPAICFNTEDQLSKKILADIESWENNFKSETITDNYFQCYSQIFEKALGKSSNVDTGTNDSFWCKLCDKMFQCEKQHWDEVLLPYVNSLCDNSIPRGETTLYDFLYYEFGKDFLFKSEDLPKEPCGIWTNLKQWNSLPEICCMVLTLVNGLTDMNNYGTTEDYIQYLHITLADHPSLSELMSWTLENSISTVDIQEKAQEYLTYADFEMMLKFIAVLKEFKKIDSWKNLREDGFVNNDFNLFILWNKVLEVLNPSEFEPWLELGLRIQNIDSASAHLCYLLGNYDMKTIADELTLRKEHYDSIKYHLNFSEPSSLLTKFRELSEIGRIDEGNIYRNIFYGSKIKTLLLSIIQKSNIGDKNIEEEVEGIIHIFLLLFPEELDNNLPLKIIINTYPQLFGTVAFEKIHWKIIEDYQSIYSDREYITFQLLKRPIAAWHFLSSEGIKYFEPYITETYNSLLEKEIQKCLSTCDYEGLTNTLLRLNNRSLPIAKEILANSIDCDVTKVNSSLKLLISGTIHKIEQNWLECTSDYQNALFSTPECMYRLIPCISKLSQDPMLHNGVLSEVENVIQHFKNSFDSGEYVQVNDSSSHSLVITTGIPEQDFGYKDLISRIQIVDRQAEPILPKEDQPAPDPTSDLPKVEQDQVTLEKFEAAIEEPNNNEKPGDPITAALSYIDLLQVLPEHLRQGPIVMASSHFLRGMRNTSEPNKLYAYRNSILKLADMLFGNTSFQESALHGCLTHKYLFSIILQANQLLSKSITIENPPENGQLISLSEQNLIEKLFKSVVKISKIEPLVNIPILSCGDLSYVEKVKTHFLHQFCMDKTKEKYESTKTPRYVHAFTTFLEVANGRNRKCDFDLARFTAMETYLKQYNWKMDDMTEFMSWSPICIDEEGFTNQTTVELMYPDFLKKYERVDGFQIDYETGEITFLLVQGKPIFTETDICEAFSFTYLHKSFNCYIDVPEPDMALHPCRMLHYEPTTLQGTEILKLLIRCTNLITYFASGTEMSIYPPFIGQSIDAGILKRLPEHLQYFIRPLKERARNIDSVVNASYSSRFQLKLSEIYEEVQESDTNNEGYHCLLGDIHVQLTYESISSHEISPESSFASDFSANFEELAKHIPEFRKLKEIFKLIVISQKLKNILYDVENTEDPKILNVLPNICSSINMLGINHKNENVHTNQDSGYGILPATNTTGKVINEFDVCTGIALFSTYISGPVNLSKGSKVQVVSAQDFWTQPCEINGIQSSNFYCATSFVVNPPTDLPVQMELSDLILSNMGSNNFQWKQEGVFLSPRASSFQGWQTEKKLPLTPSSSLIIDKKQDYNPNLLSTVDDDNISEISSEVSSSELESESQSDDSDDESSITDSEESSDDDDIEEELILSQRDELNSDNEPEVLTSSMEILLESNGDSEVSEFSLPEEEINECEISSTDENNSSEQSSFLSDSDSKVPSSVVSATAISLSPSLESFCSSLELEYCPLNYEVNLKWIFDEAVQENEESSENLDTWSFCGSEGADAVLSGEIFNKEIFENNLEQIFCTETEFLSDGIRVSVNNCITENLEVNETETTRESLTEHIVASLESNIEQVYFQHSDSECVILLNEGSIIPDKNEKQSLEKDKNGILITDFESDNEFDTCSEVSSSMVIIEPTLDSKDTSTCNSEAECSTSVNKQDAYEPSDSDLSSSSDEHADVIDEDNLPRSRTVISIEQFNSGLKTNPSQEFLVIPCSIDKSKDEYVWISEASCNSESEYESSVMSESELE